MKKDTHQRSYLLHQTRVRSIRFMLRFICLCTVCAVSPAFAQWDVQLPVELQGATILCFEEVQCGGTTMLLAGTTDGIFLDPTGKAVSGGWVNISDGLPGARREVHSLAMRDSVIFAGIYGEGVYVANLSPSTIPPCRPTNWSPYSSNSFVPLVNRSIIHDSVLYAASDDGVFFSIPQYDSVRTFTESSTTNTWSKLDSSYGRRSLSVGGYRNAIISGTFLDGAHYYDLNCNVTVAVCTFLRSTPLPDFENISIHDVHSVSLDTQFIIPGEDELPCNGILIASDHGDNLYFAPQRTDSVPSAIDWWINVSPSLANPDWNWKINSILSGSFPGLPNTILVGTEYGGVLISSDCGRTWSALNAGVDGSDALDGANIRTLAVVRDSILLASSDDSAIGRGGSFAQTSTQSIGRLLATDVYEDPASENAASPLQMKFSVSEPDVAAEVTLTLRSGIKHINITVYDIFGKHALDIANEAIHAGTARFGIPLEALPSGTYFCIVRADQRLQAAQFAIVR